MTADETQEALESNRVRIVTLTDLDLMRLLNGVCEVVGIFEHGADKPIPADTHFRGAFWSMPHAAFQLALYHKSFEPVPRFIVDSTPYLFVSMRIKQLGERK